MKKLAIFDLDGTLIDSIGDLSSAVNHALEVQGFPVHSVSECRMMVGHGVRNLVKKALPERFADDDRMVDGTLELFTRYYTEHIAVLTAPYPGIADMLKRLSDKGIALAIASNKFQEGTEKLAGMMFPGISFVAVLGNRPGWPLKPSPEIVFKAMEAAGMDRNDPRGNVVMCGDSETDMVTAKNAGICGIGVGWGFRPASTQVSASVKVNDVAELEAAILQHILPQETGHP